MNRGLASLLAAAVICLGICRGQDTDGRYVPSAGRTLVFVGGSAESIGGTREHRDGYVNNVDVPAGVSEIIELQSDRADLEPLRDKLDSLLLDRCIFHLRLDLSDSLVSALVDDQQPPVLVELAQCLADYPERAFYLEIPFRMVWRPEDYQIAFRRIFTFLRRNKLANISTIYSSAEPAELGHYDLYHPGSIYYSWIGSLYHQPVDVEAALDFAQRAEKPVMLTQVAADELTTEWLEEFFRWMGENGQQVRAFSYRYEGESVFSEKPDLETVWQAAIREPSMLSSRAKPYEHIGFPKELRPPAAPVAVQMHPYRDSSKDLTERVEDLLARMTVEEKIAQLICLPSPPWLLSREVLEARYPHGIGVIDSGHLSVEADAKQYLALQDYLTQHTRLGVPAIRQCEAAHGLLKDGAVSFPTPLALSCSWDVELVEQIYAHIAAEARARGIQQVVAPSMDLSRELRWGQLDHTLGEDVYLASQLATAMIRGLQGGGESEGFARDRVAAVARHLGGRSDPEGGIYGDPYQRERSDYFHTEISGYRQIFDKTQPAALIVGSNDLLGMAAMTSDWLLRDVLRKQLAYGGLIYSQRGSLESLGAEMVTTAIAAGVQIEFSRSKQPAFADLKEQLDTGQLSQSSLDTAVRAMLEHKFRLRLFDSTLPSVPLARVLANNEGLAHQAARQSLVLLENREAFLPLQSDQFKKIAVIGPNSDTCRLGSFSGTPVKTSSLLEAVTQIADSSVEILHAPGSIFALNDTNQSYKNLYLVKNANLAPISLNEPLIAEAVSLAERADVVILALGESEFSSRNSRGPAQPDQPIRLDLSESQKKLAEAILATGKPVVLYLAHGRPITLGHMRKRFRAILTGHFNGQATGRAAAEAIFGKYNPSGKLTVSWPTWTDLLPVYYNKPVSLSFEAEEGIGKNQSVAYPFGHGLSYTQYRYGQPSVSSDTLAREGDFVRVAFELENVGEREGTEIAQLYVTPLDDQGRRLTTELKAFSRVTLQPGASLPVSLKLRSEDLLSYGAGDIPKVPIGSFHLQVGPSSAELSEPLLLKTTKAAAKEKVRLPFPEVSSASSKGDAGLGVPAMELSLLPVDTLESAESLMTEIASLRRPTLTKLSLQIDTSAEKLRQTIDGFGGGLVDSGMLASEDALHAAIKGLNTNIIRVRGEVSATGDAEHNRTVLTRAMAIKPDLEVLLSFWQPRSAEHSANNYWLEPVSDESPSYQLKPEREDAWADEILARTEAYLDWGVNVKVLSLECGINTAKSSPQSCSWESERLAVFIEEKLRPRLLEAGLEAIRIAAPDLTHIGPNADQIDRFIPTLTSPGVDIATYQMYDSYASVAPDYMVNTLRYKTIGLDAMRARHFPEKRLWMTDTSGAHWYTADRHTHGWSPDLDAHGKAIKAARYLHICLTDAQANAFLWKGLVASEAPPSVEESLLRDGYLDKGLVLVAAEAGDGEVQELVERTKKFYTFRQYSGFVKPGYRRIHINYPESLPVAAFLSPESDTVVAIVINDHPEARDIEMTAPGAMRLIGSFQTDRKRNCSPVDATAAMPPESVRTFIFTK